MVIDAGTNLFTLGLAYLAFKFLVPIIMGFILIALAYYFIHAAYPDFFTVNPQAVIGLLAAIIVIIVLSL